MNIGPLREAEKKAMCGYRRKRIIIALIPAWSALMLAVGADVALGQPCEGCEGNESAKLLASDGQADDSFGFSVDVCGDIAVVGKPQNGTPAGTGPGAAYVFEYIAGAWNQIAILTASDGVTNDQFGYSVACSGDTILVGAIYDEDNGWHSGSAYIFEKPAGGWSDMTETVKLLPSDGFVSQTFGYPVDIDGDTAVIGGMAHDTSSPGGAYVYVMPTSGWSSASSPMFETAKLTASDGVANDRGGSSVGVSGDWIMFGAVYDSDGGFRSGSVYAFEKPPTGWAGVMTEDQKLTASAAMANALFGHSLSIDGTAALIGAPFDANGSAYVFELAAGIWTESAKLSPCDGAPNAYHFAQSVCICGDIVLIGAPQQGLTGPGSVYVYLKPQSGWISMIETARLYASDGAPGDSFGYDVACSSATAVVGSLWDDDNGEDSGSAYVFTGLSDCNNQPPLITCNGPVVLWSPNHDLVDVGSAISISDPDNDPVTTSFRVFSDEPETPETGDGTGRHAPDFKNEYGTGRGLLVRSERQGRVWSNGRFYVVVVTADDGNGGVTTEVCIAAVVPHDQNDPSSLDAVMAQAQAGAQAIRDALPIGGNPPPPGLHEHGLAGPVGPKQ